MTDQGTPKPYDLDISVAAGRDVTWQAITQLPLLHQWFGWDYDGLDAEIKQIFVDEATLWGPETMGWADGSRLEVSGDDGRARVRAVREGDGPGGPDRYDAIEEGWRAFLVQLRFLLEARPDGRRRTLYLTGDLPGRQALSIAEGEWQHFGPRVASTVDGAGNLVVVAGRLPLDDPAAERVEVTVSTYGLDDAAFDELREKWSQRWAAVAAGATATAAGDPAPGDPAPGDN